jgi:hypothetical protein
MNRLNKQQLEQIRERILPAADHYNRTGTLKGTTLPPPEFIQDLHLATFGYKYDQGCPACIGDAVRLLGNAYRDQVRYLEESDTEHPEAGAQYQDPDMHQIGDVTVVDGIVEGFARGLEAMRDAYGRFIKRKQNQPELPPSPGDLHPGEEDPA